MSLSFFFLFMKITNFAFNEFPFELDIFRAHASFEETTKLFTDESRGRRKIWIVKRHSKRKYYSWYRSWLQLVLDSLFFFEHLKFIFNLKTPKGSMRNVKSTLQSSIILIPLNVDETCVLHRRLRVRSTPFRAENSSLGCECQVDIYSILCLHMKLSNSSHKTRRKVAFMGPQKSDDNTSDDAGATICQTKRANMSDESRFDVIISYVLAKWT